MSDHTQNVSVSYPFSLSHTDQIPFFFCAIPYHLIDKSLSATERQLCQVAAGYW